jgi:ribosomal protein L11 methyltransferase
VARANIVLNVCANRVRTFVVDGVPRGRFDLIVANILAGPLVRLAPALRRAIAPGGAVVLSGLLTWQAAEVTAAYIAQGFALRRNNRVNGWSALTLVQRDQRRTLSGARR